MKHHVLTVGLTDELFYQLQSLPILEGLRLTSSLTVQDASRLLTRQNFQLLIVDLSYLRDIQQINWINSIRRSSFIPVVVLSNAPEVDTLPTVQLGADLCLSGSQPSTVIAALVLAQLRRYTAYNHYGNAETAAFQVGDIQIDPSRRTVQVKGLLVNLRPREFSLLLYFMRNPGIVLTSAQICEHAWGAEGNYAQGISSPVAILRKAIEANASRPRYIETVPRIGYRFTAYDSETCDNCCGIEGVS